MNLTGNTTDLILFRRQSTDKADQHDCHVWVVSHRRIKLPTGLLAEGVTGDRAEHAFHTVAIRL